GDAVVVLAEAHLEQLHLVRGDRLQGTERARVYHAAGVLLHLEAVQKDLLDAVARDHVPVSAEQARAMIPQGGGDGAALFGGADVRRVGMDWGVDEAKT